MRIRYVLTLCLTLASFGAAGETRYVDDELTITMRSGESTQHQILRTLASGARVDLLTTHPDTGYSQIRTSDGVEGWVLTRYLSQTPIARQRLKAAEKELGDLKGEVKELKKALTESDKLKEEIERTQRELTRIRNISGNAVALSDENQSLKTELIKLETELQTVRQENVVLKDRSARDWFIAGTGVTLLGLAIGLAAPRLSMRKRSSWSEL